MFLEMERGKEREHGEVKIWNCSLFSLSLTFLKRLQKTECAFKTRQGNKRPSIKHSLVPRKEEQMTAFYLSLSLHTKWAQ